MQVCKPSPLSAKMNYSDIISQNGLIGLNLKPEIPVGFSGKPMIMLIEAKEGSNFSQ